MEEDAEPNEELTGNDFTYSHDTTTAFQELLTMIDSTTKELPDVLSTKHYAALTQLPLTYPWARLVLDMKELLLSFDRHLITCLIANQVQGNDPPHPGTVLSSFLHHLGQLILLIIAPHDTDDAPPFLQHPEIYGIEFWHAHLNLRKLGTRILLPPALLSKQQDSPQLPQWIVNPFRTTQAHRTRSVLFT